MPDEFLKQALPKWANSKVKSIEDIEKVYFYFTTNPVQHQIIQEVLLSNVMGTIHSDYNNGSWIEMLTNLKRIKKFSSIQQVRTLVDSSMEKVTLYKFRKEYLIGCGNHRTCILKFYDDEGSINAIVKEFVLDEELLYGYEKLVSYGFDVDKGMDYPSPNTLYWTIQFSEHYLFLYGRDEILKFKAFYESLKTDKFSLFNYWYRAGSTTKSERVKAFRFEDLERFKYELAKFKESKMHIT